MAATERVLRKLPVLAAGLSALAGTQARAQSTLDFKYLFYKEQGGRTEVGNPSVFFHQDMGEAGGTLTLLLGYDTITGASPTGGYPSFDTTTSASGVTTTSGTFPMASYEDTRKSATVSYGHRFGAHLPSIDLSRSRENDYLANGLGLSDSWVLAGGRGTLHYGASISRDTVSPVTNDLDFDKSSNSYALGWTWILGERDLLDVSGSLSNLSGYLDDPYKIVTVGTLEQPEHRPDARARYALVAKLGHYFTVRGALKTMYRYYWDDWSIRAHTLDLTYDQRIGSAWIVSPRVRLYSQTAASFYASKFDVAQPYMSADYRLSPFDSWLAGLDLSYEIRHAVRVSVGGTYQSQHGKDRIIPAAAPTVPALGDDDDGDDGEGGAPKVVSTSSADLTTLTFTLGISWRF